MNFRKLNHLSLISNVCNELETHMGQTEKILAEFIVNLARSSETVDEFDKKLKEEGMEFPDYFVRSLLTMIHAIYPPKRKFVKKRYNGKDGDKERFKCLAIKDTKDKVKELEKEIEREVEERRREDDRNRDRDHGRDHDRDRRESGRDLDRDRDRGYRRDGQRERTDGEDRRSDRHRERNRRDHGNDIDQKTGKDLVLLKKPSDDDSSRSNPSYRTKDGHVIVEESDVAPSRRPLKKMSSPERWEAQQLIASGILRVDEFPMYDEDGDRMLYQEEGDEEELEIEMNEDEPAFLQGQTRYSVDMSPVKILKNPEGSLSRSAAFQSALTKERREMREQQQRTMLDSIPKDLNRPLEDPMPETGERHLAQELRGVGLSAYDMPEWKKDALGKTPTFGQRSKLSIQEQRESLPIYCMSVKSIQ